jgi:hypothetical protein
MQTFTATPADTQLFEDYVKLAVEKGINTARDFLERALEATKLTQGNSASLDQYNAFIRLQREELCNHKPVVSSDTMEAMRPTINLANSIMNDNQSKQWTGASAMSIYLDVIRGMQAISTHLQVKGSPHCAILHPLSQMPNRLLLALSRLSAEAFPAIVNAAENQAEAAQAVQVTVIMINKCAVIPLLEAHEELLYEREQHHELCKWTALEGSFLKVVQTVPDVFGHMTMLTKTYAPRSNPQAPMVEAEARYYLKELNETLVR